MKQMILTPEWVLQKLPVSSSADGNGEVIVYTDNATDSDFIELALNTLEIQFEHKVDCIDEDDELSIEFKFHLEDIQNHCPSYYDRMREVDINNHGRNIKMKDEQIFEIVKERVIENFRFYFESAMDDCFYEEFTEQYFPNHGSEKMQEFKKLSLNDKLKIVAEFFQNNLHYLKEGVWNEIIEEANDEIELD
jgi:hypothetical protein